MYAVYIYYVINPITVLYGIFNYKIIVAVQTLTRSIDLSQQTVSSSWLQGWQYVLFHVDWFLSDPCTCRYILEQVCSCMCLASSRYTALSNLGMVDQGLVRKGRSAEACLVSQSSWMEVIGPSGSDGLTLCECFSSVNFLMCFFPF